MCRRLTDLARRLLTLNPAGIAQIELQFVPLPTPKKVRVACDCAAEAGPNPILLKLPAFDPCSGWTSCGLCLCCPAYSGLASFAPGLLAYAQAHPLHATDLMPPLHVPLALVQLFDMKLFWQPLLKESLQSEGSSVETDFAFLPEMAKKKVRVYGEEGTAGTQGGGSDIGRRFGARVGEQVLMG